MRHHEYLFDWADWLTDPPSGGPLQMWLVGAGLSSFVTLYGLSCCLTRFATTISMARYRPGFWTQLSGTPAVTYGMIVIFIGLFIHFQWFWGNHKKLFPFHEIGKYSAALGVAVAAVIHVLTVMR